MSQIFKSQMRKWGQGQMTYIRLTSAYQDQNSFRQNIIGQSITVFWGIHVVICPTLLQGQWNKKN